MTVTGQFSCPPTGRFVAVPGQFLVAADNLLEAGLLEAGTSLHPGYGDAKGTATVEADGGVSVAGLYFNSPSGAGKYLTGRPTIDGWRYWRLEDGRSLRDVRSSFTGVQPAPLAFDE